MTTLQCAQICERIIESSSFNKLLEISYVHHFVLNEIVNKYELMNIFNEVFDKKLKINHVNKPDEKVDRTLSSNFDDLSKLFDKSDIKTALTELSDYIEKSDIFNN